MATKKSNKKKPGVKTANLKKVPVKKTSMKKIASPKIAVKKTIAKKASRQKLAMKTKAKNIIKNMLVFSPTASFPADADCACMQKRPNGKFYNFTLQQGRWVQSSPIPFPTKESCEDACC
jgi:hypothetical protein